MVRPNKTAQKSVARAPEIRLDNAATTSGQDFVVTALQSSADDAIKLAYGSMTLPPKQFLDLFAKVGEQYMSFVAKRMQAQAERVQVLARCANLEDVAKAEAAFYGKAAEDYAEQLDRLSETTHGAAQAAEGKA